MMQEKTMAINNCFIIGWCNFIGLAIRGYESLYNIEIEPSLKAELQGWVAQSLIKLFHDNREFGLRFLTKVFCVYRLAFWFDFGLYQESMTQKH